MNEPQRVILDVSDLSGDPTPVSLADFLDTNQEVPLPDGEVSALRRLRVGEKAHLGVGGGHVVVRRVR